MGVQFFRRCREGDPFRENSWNSWRFLLITGHEFHELAQQRGAKAAETGVPYQRLLNQFLTKALQSDKTQSCLGHIEEEVNKLKRKIIAQLSWDGWQFDRQGSAVSVKSPLTEC